MAANSGEKAMAARFRWDKGDKVHNLIKCLASYKVTCIYEGKDFNVDKPKLYECLREEIARIYQDEPSYFEPVNITADPFYVKSKDAMNAILKRFPAQSYGFQPWLNPPYNRLRFQPG